MALRREPGGDGQPADSRADDDDPRHVSDHRAATASRRPFQVSSPRRCPQPATTTSQPEQRATDAGWASASGQAPAAAVPRRPAPGSATAAPYPTEPARDPRRAASGGTR